MNELQLSLALMLLLFAILGSGVWIAMALTEGSDRKPTEKEKSLRGFAIFGTPEYMAPEQVAGDPIDGRTDVYALGTMLFEMLTGNLPFAGSNVYAMMRAKGSEDPQPPSRFVPEVDPHLEEIILRAIERLPRNRYQSAVEMLADLNAPEQVAVTGRAQRLHPRSLRALRVRRALMMVLFFASLAGILVALVWLANRYPAAQPRAGHSFRGEVK